MKLKGETVYVAGQAVDDVLVHVGDPSETSDVDHEGANADYTLYFPMDYTDDLTDKAVTVRGLECEVIGHPDHERPAQVFDTWHGSWDMTVKVRRVIYELAESIVLKLRTVSRDELGDRTVVEEELYSGPAQVRKADGGEDEDGRGTTATETWYFVIPYKDAYTSANAQTLFVEYDGRTYDVRNVEDVGWAHETASIEATWHE